MATVEFSGNAESELRHIAEQLANPQALYKDMGRAVANQLRKHFRERNSQPNRLGGNRTHFWLDVRDSVQQPQLISDGVSIAITHDHFPQKYFGGTITVKNKPYLTIPIHALAHGRWVSTFQDEQNVKVFRQKSKKGNLLLFADLDGEGAGEPIPIYWLVKSVDVPKDPRALPPEAEMINVIMSTGRAHLARMLARA